MVLFNSYFKWTPSIYSIHSYWDGGLKLFVAPGREVTEDLYYNINGSHMTQYAKHNRIRLPRMYLLRTSS